MATMFDDLPEEKLYSPIESLNLPCRPYNSLKRAGINFVWQILDLGAGGILQIRHLGKLQFDIIFDALARHLGLPKQELLKASTDSSEEEPIPDKIAQLPISVLNLSTRATNAIIRANISTIEDLLKARIRGIGEKTSGEIASALAGFLESSTSLTDEEIEKLKAGRPYDYSNQEPVPDKIAQLPVSVLNLSPRVSNALSKANISTIEHLLKAKYAGFVRVRGIGKELSGETASALTSFLESSTSLTDEEIEKLKDSRPSLIAVPLGAPPNLVKLIEPFSKELPNTLGNKRDFEVLKRRHGLEGSKAYTLQEVGDYYNMTRERVRQIERRGEKAIREFLLGQDQSPDWKIPERLVDEAKALSRVLQSGDEILIEPEIVAIVEDRYRFKCSTADMASVRFLLHILDFEPLATSVIEIGSIGRYPAWVMSKDFKKGLLYDAIRAVHNVLCESVLPLSLFDITVRVNRHRKSRIPTGYVNLAIKICKEAEEIQDEHFQMKLEYLPSLADKAYRILHENKIPLHIRDILRTMNHKLVQAGVPKVEVRSVAVQLVADPRFEPIGRSRIWSLSEWENIRRETILEIMEEFFHLKQRSASADEVCEYVQSKRPDVSRSSVMSYLVNRKDKFVRISSTEYGLVAWGIKPSLQVKQKRYAKKSSRKTIREITKEETEKFLRNQPGHRALVADIANHVLEIVKCSEHTVYAYLSQMESVQKEKINNKLYYHLKPDTASSTLVFPRIEEVESGSLKENLYRAIRNLNVENVDMGLFQLGRIFESELRSFLLEAQRKQAFPVTNNDLQRLASMIDCVERNGIIKKQASLTFLRQERNERAHGDMPDLAEREELMKQASSLAGLFIDYIIRFHKKRGEL